MAVCKYCGSEMKFLNKTCPNCGAYVTGENKQTNNFFHNQNSTTTSSGVMNDPNKKPLQGGLVGFLITIGSMFICLSIVGLIICLIFGDSKCKRASFITFIIPIIIFIIMYGIILWQGYNFM